MNNAWTNTFNLWAGAWAVDLRTALWQGSLAIALVWVVCRCLPRLPARLRCWLWRIAYIKLLATLIWTPPIDLPLLPASRTASEATREAAVAPTFSRRTEHRASKDSSGDPMEEKAAVAAPDRIVGTILSHRSPTIEAEPSQRDTQDLPSRSIISPNRRGSLTPAAALFLLWLLGVGASFAGMTRHWNAANRLRRECKPVVDPAVLAEYAELCARFQIRRAPRLLATAGDCSPLLLGGRRPAVILPQSLLTSPAVAELRPMLAHELAHCKRCDLLWNWLPAFTHCLLFFHPLLWLAGREWRLAQEMASDEQAVFMANVSVEAYGMALLRAAAGRPLPQRSLSMVSALDTPQTLKLRILAMRHIGSFSPAAFRRASLTLAALGLVGIAPWRVVAARHRSTDSLERNTMAGAIASSSTHRTVTGSGQVIGPTLEAEPEAVSGARMSRLTTAAPTGHRPRSSQPQQKRSVEPGAALPDDRPALPPFDAAAAFPAFATYKIHSDVVNRTASPAGYIARKIQPASPPIIPGRPDPPPTPDETAPSIRPGDGAPSEPTQGPDETSSASTSPNHMPSHVERMLHRLRMQMHRLHMKRKRREHRPDAGGRAEDDAPDQESDRNTRRHNLGINLSGARLDKTPLNSTSLNSLLHMAGGDVSGSLSRLNLTGRDLTHINLRHVKLAGLNLTGVNLAHADLSGLDLTKTNLKGANLARVNLSGARLTGANLTGANLAGADLTGVNLTQVNLRHVNLARVNLTGANLSHLDLSGMNLSRADLTGANLRGAILTNAILTDAILTDAILTGAILTNAILTGARF